MSRIGKKPVPIASGVKVQVSDTLVKFEGPKGKLELKVNPVVKVALDSAKNELVVTRRDDEKFSKAMHGTTRSLLVGHIKGVAEGYARALEVQGVGYKADLQGQELVLTVGFANNIHVKVPAGLNVAVEGNKINVSGPDKQLVGQFAADVRKVRKPEPYKGKGIRYVGEVVKIKPGKAVTGTGAAK